MTVTRHEVAGPELRELVLAPGEEVRASVRGFYNHRPGALVATSERIVLVDGLHYEQFAYDELTAIRYKAGLLLARVTLVGDGSEAQIEGADIQQAAEFCARVQPLLRRSARARKMQ